MDRLDGRSYPVESSTSNSNSNPEIITKLVDSATHERLLRDYKRLKIRLDNLEKENESLRGSLWEISWRWGKGKAKAREEINDLEVASTTTTTTTPANITVPPGPPTPTDTASTSRASVTNSPFLGPNSTEFMLLNEAIPKRPLPLPVNLPSTPASIAASLFPSRPAPRPVSPSSSSSRANPTARDASLKRDLDIGLPQTRQSVRSETRASWKWGRGYDLKGHRAGIYALEFSDGDLPGKGRLLGSAGYDGIRLWAPKASRAGDDEEREREEDGDAWDDGDVEEFAHLTNHSGPVADIAFSPDTTHLLSGGYDSHLYVFPLTAPSSSGTAPYTPIYSLATEGLAQTVSWMHPNSEQGSESGNIFAWGTSGKVLGVGDLRMEKPAIIMNCDVMINSIQSFRRSPHLLVGDSSGQIRHFSIRTSSFLPFPEPTPTSNIASNSIVGMQSTAPAPIKKGIPISCLSLPPDWGRKGEPRWLARIGFDNLIQVYDRGFDPLKSQPKLTQTLKGKNRNWPIKASWFQGRDYADSSTGSKRRPAASRTRSRANSFDSEHQSRFPSSRHGSDSEEDYSTNSSNNNNNLQFKPLSSSLLLAVGSSDPVVLLYDLSKPITSTGNGNGTPESVVTVQRLEGHKDSVYTTSFLQSGPESRDGGRISGYQGDGVLASAGGDCVVKIWKPVFADVQ